MASPTSHLPYCHVETALLDFVFDEAATLLTLVTEDFGEHPLEGIVTDGLGDRLIAIVTNVEGCAEEMT